MKIRIWVVDGNVRFEIKSKGVAAETQFLLVYLSVGGQERRRLADNNNTTTTTQQQQEQQQRPTAHASLVDIEKMPTRTGDDTTLRFPGISLTSSHAFGAGTWHHSSRIPNPTERGGPPNAVPTLLS